MRTRPALALAVLAVAAAPASAYGHASFVGATPAPGSRVEQAPRQIALRFSERVDRRLSSVRLVALKTGTAVAVELRAATSATVTATPSEPLARGAYRVEWRTVSPEDGHTLRGEFPFGVRTAAIGTARTEQSPVAGAGWVRIPLRIVLYTTVLLFVAALTLPLLLPAGVRWLAPPALVRGPPGVPRRTTAPVADLGWLATAAAAGVAAEAATAAGGLRPTALADYLIANGAGSARLAVVVLLAAAALLADRRRRMAAALALTALGAIALSGHAGSASPRSLSVFNDWLHLVAGSLWIGGLGLIAWIWAPVIVRADRSLRTGVMRHVLVPFGAVALPAFAVVTVSGLLSLVTQLGRLDALWETGYGRLLAVKIVFVGLIAGASLIHAMRLRPGLLRAGADLDPRADRRHWRLVRSEPVLGLLIIAVVAVLTAYPLPPSQADRAQAQMLAAAACSPCPLPRPSRAELPVADAAGSSVVAGWIRRRGAATAGVLRVTDARGRPSRVPVRVAGARTESCGPGCTRFADPAGAATLRVTLPEEGRSYTARLPTRWRRDGAARARRLVGAAEEVMRRIRTVRETERLTSGPGSYARTRYRLLAPDRMAYETDGGVSAVIAGERQWTRVRGGPWQRSRFGEGLPFSTRGWFRWSPYARTIRLLGVERSGGRRIAKVALFDGGTPVWLRMRIDLNTRRVLSERMVARGRYTRVRYFGFDRRLAVTPPRDFDVG